MVDVSETQEIGFILVRMKIVSASTSLTPNAENVIEIARDQQAFGDFRMPSHCGQEFLDISGRLPGEPDRDDSADAEAKRSRVDPCAVARDDTALL
jgi:hypothetical protein